MNDFIQPLSDEFNDIYFVKGARDGRYPYSNSLLIKNYLIDTGISTRLLRKLKRQFPIDNVLLSHWHEDHTSGNRLLPESKFYIHEKDKYIIENVNKFGEYYGVSNTDAAESFGWLMEGLRLEDTQIEKTLEGDEIIKIGNDYKLEVIHTPGHTAGHCAFIELNSKIAFIADIDLTNFVFYAGIDSNLMDFEASLAKLKEKKIEIAVTGHHHGVIKGANEIEKGFKKYESIIRKSDQRILSFFSETKPISVADFRNKNVIYKYYSDFHEYEIVAELIMVQKHFDKFLNQKLIQPKERGFILN